MKIFNKISADDFFQNYWQKKPLVIRDAISNFISPLDPDELAGLACEEEIDSRLILEMGGTKPWEVISGPLSEEILKNLPQSNWSLSVQGVDRLIPDVSKLLSYFKFLPNWLLDDVLVSYAPDKGSVGAHIDNYDVFILQGQGKRRWLLGAKPEFDEKYQEGLDIRLLETFKPELEWELNSGDLLYIPTRFAHHGIAVGECLNYSIGFRAPTDGELIRSFSSWAIENEIVENFFSQSNMSFQQSSSEITQNSLDQLAEHMKVFIESPDFKLWFGKHITEPKTFLSPLEEELYLSKEQLVQKLKSGEVLVPAAGLKRSWINSGEPMLFIEGEKIELPKSLNSEILAFLCDSNKIEIEDISNFNKSSDDILQLLTLTYNMGYFIFEEEL